MDIPFFTPGTNGPSPFSAMDMNVPVALLRCLSNIRIEWGETNDAVYSNGGLTIKLNRGSTNSGGATPTLGMYLLKSVQDDFLTAHTWDGTTEGSDDIFIAKEENIRTSLASQGFFSVTHVYSYASGPDGNNLIRTNDDGTNAQDEIITPPWRVDEVIFAITTPTDVFDDDANPITLLLVRNAQWGKISPLAVTPQTPASASDTTNGYGAGLITTDGAYIYVSTGADTWVRVALATW